MKKIEIKLVEGYWRNPEVESTFIYPVVRERTKTWKGRRAFIAALKLVQASKLVEKKNSKGWSNCRCCGKKNGSAEFHMRIAQNVVWSWPQGFLHYVEDHNIRPSLAFQQLITQVAATLDKEVK